MRPLLVSLVLSLATTITGCGAAQEPDSHQQPASPVTSGTPHATPVLPPVE